MSMRKHWKKILLALFASLWAGCESNTTEAQPLYGVRPCDDESCTEAAPDYGVIFDPEFEVITDSVEEQPMVYGPPCYFEGNCEDESKGTGK